MDFLGCNGGGGSGSLTATLTDSTDPAPPSSSYTYTLSVTNPGAIDAGAVTAVITLPSSVTFVSDAGVGWSLSRVGQVVTGTRSQIAAGETKTITITVTAPALGGSVAASAQISSISAGSTSASQVTAIGVRIVAIIGQSNARGRGDHNDLTDTSLDVPLAAVLLKQQIAVTNDNNLTWTFYATDATQHRVDGGSSLNMGVELKLAYYLNGVVANGWALTKFAVGASDLAVDWNPAGTYPAHQDNLYTQLLTFLAASEPELNGKIAAIIWDQGEADGGDNTKTAAYQANLTSFFGTLRGSYPNASIIIRRLASGQTSVTNLASIRSTQATVQASLANSALVNSDAAAVQGDNTHFTADGYCTIGKAEALAILGLLGIDVLPVAAFSSSVSGLDVTFTDLSTDDDGTIVAWDWDFGDGSSHGTTQNPVHTYAAGGTKTVTLTVTDNAGGVSAPVSHDVIAVAVTWTIDATSHAAVPADATEWASFCTNFGILGNAAPNQKLNLQVASGNLTAVIGTLVGTAAGSWTYQVAVSGWSLRAVVCADNSSTAKFTSTQGSGVCPDLATADVLILMYVEILNSPAAARTVFGLGVGGSSVQCEARVIATPEFRVTSGNNAATSASNLSTTVHPWLLLIDRTNSRVVLYTDQDKQAPTFTSGMTGTRLNIGADAANTANTGYLTFDMWTSGVAGFSDANARTMLNGLGNGGLAWTVPW